mgnify:CR=1 FL=1
MYLPTIFYYPQFITYLHFVLYPSLFANESSFTPGYHIFQQHIYPPNTSSPNKSPSTSGYHFTKCFIYPPKSIIETFTRINLITHDCRCSPMDHHLPTYTTCHPHASLFTSGYHFTTMFIYPPKSIITSFTRILFITHDFRRSPMDPVYLHLNDYQRILSSVHESLPTHG